MALALRARFAGGEPPVKPLEQRGEKVRGFKFRRKSGYKRSWGHRDELTVLHVEKIEV